MRSTTLFIRKGRLAALIFFIAFVWFVIYYFYHKDGAFPNNIIKTSSLPNHGVIKSSPVKYNYSIHDKVLESPSKEINLLKQVLSKKKYSLLSHSSYVHAFYYAWYGTPKFDGDYYHWDHAFLGHWTSRISKQYATGKRHKPPDDIGANFYPLLGTYSSLDPSILQKHMEYLRMAGIGVIALSWYPESMADSMGKPSNDIVPAVLKVAAENGIKVCFHIEPYEGRTALSVIDDIKNLNIKFDSHPAFYKVKHPKTNILLPLYYIYDSYLIDEQQWGRLLHRDSKSSIRDDDGDAIVIGLLVDNAHKRKIVDSGFDGFYTYFASTDFSYGSRQSAWKELSMFANDNQLIFIPSVGPGYIDTNVRPWNGGNTKSRQDGDYYQTAWRHALNCNPDFISITSFNEWHEGTQIEPALSEKSVQVDYVLGAFQRGLFHYESYGRDPNLYLNLTRKWVKKFKEHAH